MDQNDHWFHVATFVRLGPFLMERGIAPVDLFDRSGVAPILFADPSGRIPRTLALRLINQISCMADDPLAAMHLIQQQQWSDFGAAGLAAEHAHTLGDALAIFVRVTRLTQSGTCITLDTSSARARLSISSIGRCSENPAQHLSAGILWMYRILRLAGDELPLEVHLDQAAPPLSADYAGLLGPNLIFGTERYEIVFDRGLLDLPVAQDITNRVVIPDDWRAADLLEGPQLVHRLVEDALPYRRPTIDRVSARLGSSTRTLQRSLERWGVTFEDIVDETRRCRALELVACPSCSMAEIACLLGYSDHAHFNRAFRRWTGLSPRAFRKFHVAPAAIAA